MYAALFTSRWSQMCICLPVCCLTSPSAPLLFTWPFTLQRLIHIPQVSSEIHFITSHPSESYKWVVWFPLLMAFLENCLQQTMHFLFSCCVSHSSPVVYWLFFFFFHSSHILSPTLFNLLCQFLFSIPFFQHSQFCSSLFPLSESTSPGHCEPGVYVWDPRESVCGDGEASWRHAGDDPFQWERQTTWEAH